MNQLSKLQKTFQEHVLNPEENKSIQWVSAEGRASPETQLSIYSHAYKARLKEVLANDYAAVLMAIGDEYFDYLSLRYIEAYPSHYFSLRDFGSHMPDFLLSLIQQKNINYISWDEMPWLYELAVFELHLGQAFDSTDATVFTENDMAAVPPDAWPELTFKLHPSVQLLDFKWNTVEMWQVLTQDEPSEITAINDKINFWLVWREELTTRFRSIQEDEKKSLELLIQGGNFTDICNVFTKIMDDNEIPMYVAGLLKGWIQQGLICNVTLN